MTIKGLASQLGNGAAWFRFTISYADLTAAATTQTIALKTIPAGSILLGLRVKPSTAFRGTAWSALTVSVGSAVGGATYFASALDCYQAVADTALQESASFKAGTIAAQAINAYFTSTGGNLSVGTAGSVDIDVLWLNCNTSL